MKTIIEIYDDEPIYNVLAPTVMRPEQVVYIGGNRITGKRIKNKIIRYFEERKLDTYAFFYPTNIYDCAKVTETLEMLIERFPDCAIDVTGGNSVLVFAIGMFCALHEVPAFAYNMKTNSFYNIYACDEIEELPSELSLKARECLAMAGASLMRHGHVDGDKLTDEDLQDIAKVWEIFRKNQNIWPRHTQYLQAVAGSPEPDDIPQLSIDTTIVRKTGIIKTFLLIYSSCVNWKPVVSFRIWNTPIRISGLILKIIPYGSACWMWEFGWSYSSIKSVKNRIFLMMYKSV